MAFDARDKEITLDSHVRYVDTGTIGKVLKIKTTDGVDWVKIDKTDLWYRSDLVELLDEKDLKKRFDDDGNNELDIEALKEKAEKMENIQMDSSVAEGGG
ncbi:DUF2098 domain-containing protein [uncultured Methanobrevibacter sp.]|uniref:DUF2098 domain-containing protein n=1 Tax=uncultured Methanobrevibacter sp. TaxID=253161 RepID=UPI0025D05413|nr:DUF2098 domain-containing protein [uncultured Methanobrevibacter sp.]